jgi:hypothetical protein
MELVNSALIIDPCGEKGKPRRFIGWLSAELQPVD